MSGSEEVMTRDRDEDKMSIYRTRVQFCVENQNALGKSGVSGYLPWASRAIQTPQTPRAPPGTQLLPPPGGTSNSSLCGVNIGHGFWISLPHCPNAPQGKTGGCSHLTKVQSRETFLLVAIPTYGT